MNIYLAAQQNKNTGLNLFFNAPHSHTHYTFEKSWFTMVETTLGKDIIMSRTLAETNPFFNTYRENLTGLLRGQTLYRDDVKDLRSVLDHPFTSAEDLLDTCHRINRIMTIHRAGLGNNPAFLKDYHALKLTSWRKTADLPVDLALQEKLADTLYNVKPNSKDAAILLFGNKSRGIAHALVNRLRADNIPFYPEFLDADFKNLVLSHARRDGIEKLARHEIALNAKANKKIIAIPNGGPDPLVEAPKDKRKIYNDACRPMRDRSGNGDLFFTLTSFPTENDAARDGIDYEEYLKLYFEMCDQPWTEITKAQDHLITLFNKASKVRFTNSDGTDISMSLVDKDGKHFTFCNSVIAKNVPGSEIFSAPRRDSINGTIVAKGRFSPRDTGNKIIENLTMHFENGKLTRFSADKGAEHFQEFLDQDAGNRYVGELGIGTNPHLKRHVMNILLVEKIGGSFHLALGNAYSFKDYVGTPVKVDNGNRSQDHWDITTMLIGKQGQIILDGTPIMKDGKFLAPELAVLNEGWAALPVNQRPAYWKNYKGPKLP